MTTDILLDPNEWEAPTGPLANLAAEAVAAERLLALDPSARWFGDNERSANVKSRTLRVDATRVTVHQVGGSCVVRLVRRDGVPFDPAVVDVLCLVHMVDDVGAAVVGVDGAVSLAYEGRAADVWWVPVDEMNAILGEFDPGSFRHVDIDRTRLDAVADPQATS